MTFEEAEQRLQSMRNFFSQGKMSREQLTAAASELRVMGPDGAWWQINPDTGGWLRWSGAAWEHAQKPSSYPPPLIHQQQPPQAGYIQSRPRPKRSTGSRIASFIVGRIFLSILAFFTAWVFHTWLLVFVNDGYNFDRPISNWLNVSGNTGSSFTIWFLASSFIWAFLATLFTAGPVRAFQSIFAAPVRLATVLKTSFPAGLGAWFTGFGIMLMVGSFLNFDAKAVFLSALLWFFLASGYPGLVVANGVRKFVNGFRTDKVNPSIFDLDVAQGLVIGLPFGLLLTMVFKEELGFFLGILGIIAGIVLITVSSASRPRMSHLGLFLISGFFMAFVFTLVDLLFPHHAHADDGGWIEFKQMNPDGDLTTWWSDSASRTAIGHGVSPAAGVAGGAFTPSLAGAGMTGDIRDGFNRAWTALTDFFSSGGGTPEPIYASADASGSVPTYKDIVQALNDVNSKLQGISPSKIDWPDFSSWIDKGVWTRSILVGLIAATLPWAAGLSGAWIVGSGVVAALADKYGPDPMTIIELSVGSGDKK